MTAPILVVDDDDAFRGLLIDILRGAGHRVLAAADAEAALTAAAGDPPALALVDQRLPGMSGHDLVRRLRAATPAPVVVLMTAFGTIPDAVEAVRLGAADYLTKPLPSPQTLRDLVSRLLGVRQPEPSDGDFLTSDPQLLEVLALADRAAPTDATVLILGESGTGKELVARRIHRASRRAAGPLVVVNCAALPTSLAESVLFGHEKGAFTGALARQRGRFEAAHGGTLFLDEVGELDEAVQAKLLRALEQRTIERVGGSGAIDVDLRLIAATNRDLAAEVAAGRFRADLYYRLDVVRLALPPLRQRRGDLELLVPALAARLARRLGTPVRPLSEAAWNLLRTRDWPGNVRELRNVLERALVAATGERIEANDLALDEPSAALRPADRTREEPAGDDDLSLVEREKQAILAALERSGGNRERAAELLGISVRTLYNRLRDYALR